MSEARTDILVRPAVDLLLAAHDADDADSLEATVDRALALYILLENPNELLENVDRVADTTLTSPESDTDSDSNGGA